MVEYVLLHGIYWCDSFLISQQTVNDHVTSEILTQQAPLALQDP